MPGTVAVRFDVSSSVGSGHLRRAVALGDELTKRQISHRYVTPNRSQVTAVELGVPKNLLIGFDTKSGENDWIQKIPQLTHVITDFCHHEHSNVCSTVNQILQPKQLHVAVIDSMPPNHFQGDKNTKPSIVVTPYLGAEKLRKKPSCRKWLVGAKYAILDSSYLSIRQRLDRNSLTTGDNILICCGGSDKCQITEYILDILLHNNILETNLNVVVGNMFEKNRVKMIKKIADQNQDHISLVFDRNNIADLIYRCGVVIGLVGLIRYESACLGKPSFLVQNHNNFEQYLRNFHNAGLGKIFLIQDQMERNAFQSIVKTLGTADGFVKNSEPNFAAFNQVDGRGGQRFLDVFLDSAID